MAWFCDHHVDEHSPTMKRDLTAE